MKWHTGWWRNWVAWVPVVLGALAATGCGGGGGGGRVLPPSAPAPTPPLQITTSSLADGVIGGSYIGTLSASGGSGTRTWSVASGSVLPSGLVLSATSGVITGMPSGPAGTATVTFQVQDSSGGSASRTLNLRTVMRLVSQVSSDLLPGAVGFPYANSLTANGGTPPYTWSVQSGGLPNGIQLSSAGQLSGTPTAFGLHQVGFQVSDAGTPPQAVFSSALFFVYDQLTIINGASTPGVVDKVYPAFNFQAVGGNAPFTWSLFPTSSPLPPGITLNTSGQLSGTPTAAGSFSFHVQVQDSSSPPRTAVAGRGLAVLPRLVSLPQNLPDAVQNRNYGESIRVQGGLPPYTATILAGALPTGISLGNWNGIGISVSGTGLNIGQFTFDVNVTDSSSPPDTVTQTVQMRINPQLAISAPSTLQDGLEGTLYSFQFVPSGGVPPYRNWGLSGGPPPPGLSLDPTTGVLGGTPARAYSDTFFVGVSDSSSPPQFTTVGPIRLTVFAKLGLTSSLPPLMIGQPANLRLSIQGGVPPTSLTVLSGGMPSGLTFDPATLAISGTPTNAESQSITLQVRDSGTSFPQTAQQTLTVSVVGAAGRNNAIATATPLSNGRYSASLSPADSMGSLQPDVDYYRISAKAGSIVSVETFAERLSPSAPTDTVIELVDATGTRLTGCGLFGPFNLFLECMNDDERPTNTFDSLLYWLVPGAAGTTTTFYVRVVSFDGNARPDYRYEIAISGAN